MGERGHGTYAKLFRDVWTHPKTFRLAEALTSRLGVPDRWAVAVAVGQFHQLLCWCVAERDDGQVGHLPAQVFARVVGWDDARKAPELLQVWKESGFLDVSGPADVHVHDFREAAADLLRKRDARRPKDGRRADRDSSGDADAVRTTGAQRPPDGAPPAAQRPPNGDPAGGLARAFGSGSGSGSGSGRKKRVRERPPSVPEIASPPDGGEAPPEPAPPKPNPNPSLRAFSEARQAAYGTPEAWPIPGKAAKEAAGIQAQLGIQVQTEEGAERWRRACQRFFADRSKTLVERRHPWGWFLTGIARYLDQAEPASPPPSDSIEDPEVREQMELQFARYAYDPKKAIAEAEATAFRSKVLTRAQP